MGIEFNYQDSANHVNAVLAEIRTFIDVPYDVLEISNEEAFRSAARALEEPTRSKVLHMLNYVVFNQQINNVYGENL